MAAITEFTRYDLNRSRARSMMRFRNAVGFLYPVGTLLKASDGATVHIVDYANRLRYFTTGEQFLGMGFKWEDINIVDRSILNEYGPEGVDPADNLGNGCWGTAITDSDPLVLEGPEVSDGITNLPAAQTTSLSEIGGEVMKAPAAGGTDYMALLKKYGIFAGLGLFGLYLLLRKK